MAFLPGLPFMGLTVESLLANLLSCANEVRRPRP